MPNPPKQSSKLRPNSEIRRFVVASRFEKLVKGSLGESSRDKKLSYNARARAHLSVSPRFSELYLPNTHPFENLMLKTLNSTLHTHSVLWSFKRWLEMAGHLNRAASTVSREIIRHGGRPAYRAHDADQQAWGAALRPKTCLLARNRKLLDIVASKLILDWSPK
jgi:hypothetical protein